MIRLVLAHGLGRSEGREDIGLRIREVCEPVPDGHASLLEIQICGDMLNKPSTDSVYAGQIRVLPIASELQRS